MDQIKTEPHNYDDFETNIHIKEFHLLLIKGHIYKYWITGK